MGSYKSKFKMQIICMIEDGYTNKQICDRLGCNQKYPVVLRKSLKVMDPGEKQQLVKRARKEVNGEDPDGWDGDEPDKQEETNTVGFNTPYKHARGRFLRG